MKRKWLYRLLLCSGLTFGLALVAAAAATEVPRISKEELKSLLNESKATVVDVRRGGDWEKSDYKIKDANREDPADISWATRYDKDQVLVLYCA